MNGRVAALFYRYKSVGGADYVTEFLIRPETLDGAGTVHGDSGTLWFWKQPPVDDAPARLRPFGMQWGGHVLVDGGDAKRSGRFALAASLSTICRELDVSIVRDWNSGLPEYWGDVGHYTIGFFACEQVTGNLGKLMKTNQERVSYPTADITSRTAIKVRGKDGFVRLADVPTEVWKIPAAKPDAATTRTAITSPTWIRNCPTSPHRSKTLLQLCVEDAANINPVFWSNYYQRVKDTSKGTLPFRVWQFFSEMKDAASKGEHDAIRLCRRHRGYYVGDACQPLHISFMFNGEPFIGPDGKHQKRGEGVHGSRMNRKMLTKNSVEFLKAAQIELDTPVLRSPCRRPGKAAAAAIIALMNRTFGELKPLKIVNAFDQDRDLWADFKAPTVRIVADGIRTLAAIWQGAWHAGHADGLADNKMVLATTKDLMALYKDPDFVPSLRLAEIDSVLG